LVLLSQVNRVIDADEVIEMNTFAENRADYDNSIQYADDYEYAVKELIEKHGMDSLLRVAISYEQEKADCWKGHTNMIGRQWLEGAIKRIGFLNCALDENVYR
jgi:hypothetical protein